MSGRQSEGENRVSLRRRIESFLVAAAIVDEVPPIAHKLLRSLAEKVRALDTKAFG